jgi:hypothetical protein
MKGGDARKEEVKMLTDVIGNLMKFSSKKEDINEKINRNFIGGGFSLRNGRDGSGRGTSVHPGT